MRSRRKDERPLVPLDRKSTRLNSSHGSISYAVFCLKNIRTLAQDLDYITAPGRYSPATQQVDEVLSRHHACRGRARPSGGARPGSLGVFFFLMKGRPRTSALFPPPPLSR